MSTPNRVVITELNIEQFTKLQTEMGNRILLVKFGADWCGPCKRIAPFFHKLIELCSPNILLADINVDNNMDLYLALKKNKMVQGVPAFLVYYGNIKRDKWFIPDDSVVGANEEQLTQLFARCEAKLATMTLGGYSYYS